MGSLQMHSLACSAWETVGICSRHMDIGKAQVSTQRASCLEETYNYLLIDEKISWLQRSNCQHLLDHGKTKRVSEKNLVLFY